MSIASKPEDTGDAQRHRPRKEEGDLEVEHDENDGDQVVAHIEAHARVLERLEPAFIRRQFLRIRPAWTQHPADREQGEAEDRGQSQENQDWQVLWQHHADREMKKRLIRQVYQA